MRDTATGDDQHGSERIVRFPPRTSATAPGAVTSAKATSSDDEPPDDFTHRMITNAAGLACAALLGACGIWLASQMADVRQTQNCVLSGRRDCAPPIVVDKPAPLRQH